MEGPCTTRAQAMYLGGRRSGGQQEKKWIIEGQFLASSCHSFPNFNHAPNRESGAEGGSGSAEISD